MMKYALAKIASLIATLAVKFIAFYIAWNMILVNCISCISRMPLGRAVCLFALSFVFFKVKVVFLDSFCKSVEKKMKEA